MAATWPVLLLLLSVRLSGQNPTGSGSLLPPTSHPPIPRAEDKGDVAVATREPVDLTEVTTVPEGRTEAETTETTEDYDDLSDQGEGQQPRRPPMTTADSPGSTDVFGLPAEGASTANARGETVGKDGAMEVADDSAASTHGLKPSASGPLGTTNGHGGALVPRINLGGQVPVAKPTEVIPPAAPPGGHAPPGDSGGYPCGVPPSRRDGLVSQCLIAIASLAALSTVFIVSTIVLCTKLSASKHRYRTARPNGAETVRISALLPDGDGIHSRPRTPKSNGALLTDTGGEEAGDLALCSFLPETDQGS